MYIQEDFCEKHKQKLVNLKSIFSNFAELGNYDNTQKMYISTTFETEGNTQNELANLIDFSKQPFLPLLSKILEECSIFQEKYQEGVQISNQLGNLLMAKA